MYVFTMLMCCGHRGVLPSMYTPQQVLDEMAGCRVHWACAVEVELDKTKREWLQSFSSPSFLLDDVTKISDEEIYNYMTAREEFLPSRLLCYTFGYSCKDLSTLNNTSAPWKDQCLSQGVGTTGQTWRGNLAMVELTRPLFLIMENVLAARSGENFKRMKADLLERGYALWDVILNAADCGFPQDRNRVYFLAPRLDCVHNMMNDVKFHNFVQDLQLFKHLPLSRFILPKDHWYLQDITAQRQQASERRSRPKQSSIVRCKPAGPAKITKRKGEKWIADHWRVRRALNMPAPLPTLPEELRAISHNNGMCPREEDLYRVVVEAPQALDTQDQPTLELKHSAPRVVRFQHSDVRRSAGQRRRGGSTSCLLPSSKLLLMPPLVDKPRYLTGVEALGLQGIGMQHCFSNTKLPDHAFMSLAGNAFCGGAYAVMFIAALTKLRFPEGELDFDA